MMQKIIKCLYIFIYLFVKKKKRQQVITSVPNVLVSGRLAHEDDFSLRPVWYFCTVVEVGDFVLLPFILDW